MQFRRQRQHKQDAPVQAGKPHTPPQNNSNDNKRQVLGHFVMLVIIVLVAGIFLFVTINDITLKEPALTYIYAIGMTMMLSCFFFDGNIRYAILLLGAALCQFVRSQGGI